jgi:trigger factor
MSKETPSYTATVTKLPNCEVEIIGSMPFENLTSYEAKALEHIQKHIELPGFRKGHVPIDMLKKHVGEQALLEEEAEYALTALYPEILKNEKVDAIGRPEIMLTKLASGNPVEFKIKTAVMPELVLPSYKKLADEAMKKEPPVEEVTEEEIEKTIMEIRKSRKAHEHDTEHEHGDHEHSHDHIKEEDLAPFDDAYVATLGDFKTVEEFRTKLKENMAAEKTHQANEKKRVAIIESIVAETKGDIPSMLVDAELDKMIHRFKGDISNMGLTFEDYMKHLGKTEDDMKADWKNDAEKRVKVQLIVGEISKKEHLLPSPEEINAEVLKLMMRYPDADETNAKMYMESVLINEKVFAFLENK